MSITVEEMNLISIYHEDTRAGQLARLRAVRPLYLGDPELLSVVDSAARKVEAMTAADFLATAFELTPPERQLIAEKMAQLGTKNTGAYLRKMAVDGYIVKLDLGSVRELVGLLRGATNNLNQIARRANETRSVYAADVEDMQARYAELWEAANKILLELAQIS